MSLPDETWFSMSGTDGPRLEDFLASDPSKLPFLQERPAMSEDFVQYQIFLDNWDSIERLQQVCI